jgi:ELWxxDGT repeat protein
MVSTLQRLFFFADDGQSKGVFLTNGTEAGTIKISNNMTAAYGFITFNTLNYLVSSPTVLFISSTSDYGYEVWKSNGTLNNTILLKDIFVGTSSSNPSNIVTLTGSAYFAASSSNNLRSLYITDGTANGTTIAVPFNSGVSSMIYKIDTLNGKLIFAANTLQNGAELWISDGTEAGTQMLKDIHTGQANAFDTLYGAIKFSPIYYKGKIYFAAKNNTNNLEPWFSNGTANGTLCLKEINSNGSSNPTSFIVCNDLLYFIAWDGQEYGIFESDGTVGNASKIWSLGTNFSNRYLYPYNNEIYFFDNTGLLKKIHSLTHQVADVMQFSADPYGTYQMYEYNGYLYFRAYRLGNYELWRTDGTTNNTIQLTITNATNSGNPLYFTEYNGSLYFAGSFNNAGIELWKLTDSTTILPPTLELVSQPNIYPNPANDIIYVNSLTSSTLHIYNSYGIRVLSVRNDGRAILVSNLPAGLYLIRDDNNRLVGKFVKQ